MAIKLSTDNVYPKRLKEKLHSRYLIQALLILISVITSIVITKLTLSHSLVREALVREADYYHELLAKDPNVPLANTKNLRGFLIPRDQAMLPLSASKLTNGYHDYRDIDPFNAAYVVDTSAGKLLLIFNRAGTDNLIYLFGILPLGFALVLLYASLWFSYQHSKQLLSPAILLAKKVRAIDIQNIDKRCFKADNPQFQQDRDIITLATAIGDMAGRMEKFVERERNFTRDVSHELRTPITVIQMATELIGNTPLSPQQQSHLKKITNAAKDMAELTEFFLLLARESSTLEKHSPITINNTIDDTLDTLSIVAENKNIALVKRDKAACQVATSPKIITVLIGNLLRNAILYTDRGQVTVTIDEYGVNIRDTGIGISDEHIHKVFNCYHRASNGNERQGVGIGLAIVKRLCDRFNWQIDIQSKQLQGTEVSVNFHPTPS